MTEQNSKRRFSGLSALYGEVGLAAIGSAHVVVIGVGGVGSWAVEALARNAVGHITMIDLDVVSESNVNRQLPALSSTLGRDKTAVLYDRIKEINESCRVDIIDDFVTVQNATNIVPSADYVIDCIDNFRVKAAIIAHCRRIKQNVITVGGAGGQLDPSRVKQVDLSRTQHDALFAKTRKLLRQDYDFPRNPKRTFSIPCVYSDEQVRYPDGLGGTTMQKPVQRAMQKPSQNTGQKPQQDDDLKVDEAGSSLSCAGGIGSSMQVTTTFALIAVAKVIRDLIASSEAKTHG
jgi:tRNA A37 threonylcarbamoyladenosine dehydratase